MIQLRDRRVLVVEDDQAVRDYFRFVLEDLDFEVVERESGAGFLEAVDEVDPELVLLDLGLPDSDGLNLLRRLRARGPEGGGVPVMVVTGDDTTETLSEALLQGADSFLIKPVSRNELQWRIKGMLRLNRYRRVLEEREARAQVERERSGLVSLLRAVTEAPGMLFVSVVPSGQVAEGNSQFRTRFEPPSQRFLDAVHPADVAGFESTFERLEAGEATSLQVSGSMVDRSGAHHAVQGMATGVTLPSGEFAVFVLLMEESAQADQDALLDRVSASDEFIQLAAGAAHDLRNVLVVLEMQAGMLELDPTAQVIGETVESVRLAVKEGKELTHLLTGHVRERDDDAAAPTCLPAPALRAVEPYLHTVTPRRITLETRIDPDLEESPERFTLPLSPVALRRIVLNLVMNARDAVSGQGTISVSLERSDRPGGGVLLEVKDTGAGMPPEVCQRIFEPLFTTKPQGKGTGLGLVVVHGLVTRAGGDVDVQSRPGKGTAFRIHLPVAPLGDAAHHTPSAGVHSGKR